MQYECLEKLGAGAFGEAVKARRRKVRRAGLVAPPAAGQLPQQSVTEPCASRMVVAAVLKASWEQCADLKIACMVVFPVALVVH